MPSAKRERQRAGREQRRAEREKQERRRKSLRRGGIIAVVVLLVVGVTYLVSRSSSSSKTTSSTTSTTAKASSSTTTTVAARYAAAQDKANAVSKAAGCPSSPSTRVNNFTWSSAPPMTIDTSKTYVATVKTDVGTFRITLDAKAAPETVNNFVFLAQKNFYNCVTFHRVIPGFMNQTGDPTGTGTGGPGYTIPDEYPPKASNPNDQYPLGSVAMANTGSPHTGGSQFFIVAGTQGESLPNSYSLFGTVTSGMDVIDHINRQGSAQGVPPNVTHRMLSVTISTQ